MKTLKEGVWRFTHKWKGVHPYSFSARLKEGIITPINDGQFFGTYTTLDGSDQVALAIADFKQQTITSYVGNYNESLMGGQMIGAKDKGKATPKGVWEAVHQSVLEVPEGEFGIG